MLMRRYQAASEGLASMQQAVGVLQAQVEAERQAAEAGRRASAEKLSALQEERDRLKNKMGQQVHVHVAQCVWA